nr:hypothetical protein [Methanocella sp. CWC-04]
MFRSSFLMYPLFSLVLSAIMGLMLLPMRAALSTFELVTLAHAGIFIAGMFVGGFAMFQDQILERRMGGIRLLLNIPGTLPITYKEVFSYFYIKDIIYYILMNVLPVLLGLYISTFVTGLHIDLLLAAVTFIIAFITGVSFTFALSTIFVRSKPLIIPVLAGMIFIAYTGLSGASSPLTTIGGWMPFVGTYTGGNLDGVAISLAAFLLLSAFSLAFIKERPTQSERRYRSNFSSIARRLSPLKKYASLAAKEWIDLTRSGGLMTVLFSFVLPLIFLWGLLWLLSSAMTFMMGDSTVSLEFNIMFYSIVIGFFSTEVYGWLNNLDSTESYKTLPISMPEVIKAKLILFVTLNTIVSVAYLSLICISRNEFSLFPFALFTMFMTSSYVGVLTAYMTGVFTNSLMFDYKVLTKYSLAVAPVLIVLIIMSFTPDLLWGSIVLAALLGIVAYVLLGRIDKKWSKTDFRL